MPSHLAKLLTFLIPFKGTLMKHIVISFIGEDQPGLVDQLSNVIKQYQGNWQDSSMHHLSGFFAGVIEIAVSEENAEALISSISAIAALETTIKVAPQVSTKIKPSIVLELTANDRSGIVQEISSVIHHEQGNLLKVVSTQESAAHTGQDLFKAKATISIDEHKIDTLIDAIENLADDIMVDVSR